jgi:probable phosphoglycerate mutase
MDTVVTVVRHGETQWNAEGRIQGHQPVGLNERGLRQAEALASRLRGEAYEAFYSSDLRRAMDTAEAISRVTGQEIFKDSRLREWKLGVLEGLASEDAALRYPEAYTAFRKENPGYLIPGGESIRQRFERSIDCINDLASRYEGAKILVVSHGGVLDDLYRFANEIPLDEPRDFKLYNASLNTFRIGVETWDVVCWGDVQHLDKIGTMGEW